MKKLITITACFLMAASIFSGCRRNGGNEMTEPDTQRPTDVVTTPAATVTEGTMPSMTEPSMTTGHSAQENPASPSGDASGFINGDDGNPSGTGDGGNGSGAANGGSGSDTGNSSRGSTSAGGNSRGMMGNTGR